MQENNHSSPDDGAEKAKAASDTTKASPRKKPQKKGVRVANRQAWVDTFVYLCPQHRGGTSVYDYCELSDGTRTNCTGRCTYNGSGVCTQVTQFFKTYIKFLNGELSFEHGGVLPPPASKPKKNEQEKDKSKTNKNSYSYGKL